MELHRAARLPKRSKKRRRLKKARHPTKYKFPSPRSHHRRHRPRAVGVQRGTRTVLGDWRGRSLSILILRQALLRWRLALWSERRRLCWERNRGNIAALNTTSEVGRLIRQAAGQELWLRRTDEEREGRSAAISLRLVSFRGSFSF